MRTSNQPLAQSMKAQQPKGGPGKPGRVAQPGTGGMLKATSGQPGAPPPAFMANRSGPTPMPQPPEQPAMPGMAPGAPFANRSGPTPMPNGGMPAPAGGPAPNNMQSLLQALLGQTAPAGQPGAPPSQLGQQVQGIANGQVPPQQMQMLMQLLQGRGQGPGPMAGAGSTMQTQQLAPGMLY